MDTMTKEISENELQAGDRVRLEGIDWDTDGDDPADLELPLELEMTIPQDWCEGESVVDVLSDRFGFCVHGISAIKRV